MKRHSIKRQNKQSRRNAFWGAAINAGAILGAAAMNVAAINASAKKQAESMKESAKIQAESIKQQSNNNTQLQKESIDFTRQQNQENRQQQQDIQTTLQMLAGQENMNDRLEKNKMAVKYGGRPKYNLKQTPFYRGANKPFKVTDGGGVIPIQTDINGYGLYELYGNDHEHYHKAPGGKNKTGVGIKFPNGTVVEGEGNQNSNQGELMYVTPEDALFISKHSIKGFNPTKAVLNGVHPMIAFNIQEQIKDRFGYKDNGNKIKKIYGGQEILNNVANISQFPSNGTVDVAGGTAYVINNTSSPVEELQSNIINTKAKNGKRISIKHCGGRTKALGGLGWRWGETFTGGTDSYGNTYIIPTSSVTSNTSSTVNTNTTGNYSTASNNSGFWNNYGGSIINAGGNLLGAGLSWLGNNIASNTISKAYNEAANTIANAYRQMTGIDESILNAEDYEAPHAMAVVRSANTNINPQLERLRRNAERERREVNASTLSSAARQQRLAAINDRMYQRIGEAYATKHNQDEAIKQENARSITQTSQFNAAQDIKARENYTRDRLSLKQYNNSIENQKLAGIAQAYADATSNSATVQGNATQSSINALASAISSSAGGFANAFDIKRQNETNLNNVLLGADMESKVLYAITNGNKNYRNALINSMQKIIDNPNSSKEAKDIANKYLAMLS